MQIRCVKRIWFYEMTDETENYSLRDIVAITGAKPRSIQTWADAEAIIAVHDTDRAGSGTHRRFSRDEVELAAILAPLADFGVTIGGLRRCGKAYRALSKGKRRDSEKFRDIAAILERARAGLGRNYFIYDPAALLKEGIRFYGDDCANGSITMPPPSALGVVIDLNAAFRGFS